MTSAADKQYDPKLSLQEQRILISNLGIKKANTKAWQLLILGFLAGLYIAIGSQLFLTGLAHGLTRTACAVLFSLGLVLVVVAGAELFTGNIIMIVGAISTLYSPWQLLRNWVLVYVGNFLGALAFVGLQVGAGVFVDSEGLTTIGKVAVTVSEGKLALGFGAAFCRGIGCNMLVVLAIIMSFVAKDIVSKILLIVFPIMAFVVMGYEHCVANMYLIPAGLAAHGAPVGEWLTMFGNIVPVTLGNVVGGLFILLIHPNRLRQLGELFRKSREAGMRQRAAALPQDVALSLVKGIPPRED